MNKNTQDIYYTTTYAQPLERPVSLCFCTSTSCTLATVSMMDLRLSAEVLQARFPCVRAYGGVCVCVVGALVCIQVMCKFIARDLIFTIYTLHIIPPPAHPTPLLVLTTKTVLFMLLLLDRCPPLACFMEGGCPVLQSLCLHQKVLGYTIRREVEMIPSSSRAV